MDIFDTLLWRWQLCSNFDLPPNELIPNETWDFSDSFPPCLNCEAFPTKVFAKIFTLYVEQCLIIQIFAVLLNSHVKIMLDRSQFIFWEFSSMRFSFCVFQCSCLNHHSIWRPNFCFSIIVIKLKYFCICFKIQLMPYGDVFSFLNT